MPQRSVAVQLRDPALADYARSSIEWHGREMAWLAEHRDELVAMVR